MRRKDPNAGALNNFEVLDFLRSRGASKEVSRVTAPVSPSEYKDQINEFVEKCKAYDLPKAEILNIIDICPSELVEIDPIIEESDECFGEKLEELLELVKQVLPLPQPELDPKEGIDEDRGETGDEN